MTPRDVDARLRDILNAIEAIAVAQGIEQQYAGDVDIPAVDLAAIQFHVFTIGEAVKNLPTDVTGRAPGVPWSQIARMRDLIGHHYYKLDAEIVRATIEQPLAVLRETPTPPLTTCCSGRPRHAARGRSGRAFRCNKCRPAT